MTTSGYSFRTWLVAHALHPLIWLVGSVMSSGTEVDRDPLGAFYLSIIAFFLSLPAIWISWAIVDLILSSSMSALIKFLVWMICAPIITYMNAIALIWILSGSYDLLNYEGTFFFIVPAMIATMLSVIIRSRQFFIVNGEAEKRKILEEQSDQTIQF